MRNIFYLFIILIGFSSCTKLEEPIPGISNKVEISTISPVTRIGSDSAFAGGSITKDGGENISERGVVWSTNSNPTTSSKDRRKAGSGLGSFLIEIDTLLPNTDYFVKAYAINYYGTVYGQQVSFKTIKGIPRFIGTNLVSKEAYRATVSAFISLDGGEPVTSRGFCYSKNPNPTLLNSSVLTSGNGILSYEGALTNLLPNTKYFVRPFASNKLGTAYGKQIEFTTDIGPVIIDQFSFGNVTATSVRLNANILSAEGGTVRRRGFVISKTSEPFLYNAPIVIEGGANIGPYSVDYQGLEMNTIYYVKAFGINESSLNAGVTHTPQLVFTTLGRPSVQTKSFNNIGYTNFTAYGQVLGDGGSPIRDRGFIISTNSVPSENDRRISIGGQVGDFQADITGLSDNQTYYFRAYATNDIGIALGGIFMVRTLAFAPPSVQTISSANAGYTLFTGFGRVSADGGRPILERGFVVSTNSNPTENDRRINIGGGVGEYQANINSLNAGQLYYFRAYARNDRGLTLGVTLEVKTLDNTEPQIKNSPTIGSYSQKNLNVTGQVDSDGGLPITERGFLYSRTNTSPGLNDTRARQFGTYTQGGFSLSLTGLVFGNITYYVRTYAINSKGIGFGPVNTFRTPSIIVPTVRNSSVSSVTSRSATISGSIDSDGNGLISYTGFLVSENANMSSSSAVVGSGYSSSNPVFSRSLTGLSPNRFYYFQALATNEGGTSTLPSAASFQTLCEPGVVGYLGNSRSSTSISVNYSLSNLGGDGSVLRGACISSTNANPQIGGSGVITSSGTQSALGSFAISFPGLIRNRIYYVQSFVTNCFGTSYGGVRQISTLP